ncbi:DsbC family protein [Endozoicomonas sp. 8E]|uniref:DsbC family protein n=1 Tax=Endozoicomonas sp. 8E TaxID=3035692 RepID=UPI002939471A|nr:DsbC family protein [Endozoicomonas sp. 8E]WOG25632.1 DsbC family protein [Endozoicomonas sp. 8E]
MRLSTLILSATLATTPFLRAAPLADQTTEEVQDAITSELKGLDPNIPIKSIEKSGWGGVFRVTLEGGSVIYSNETGKLLLRGDMLEINNGQIVNLTEELRNKAVADQLKSLKKEDQIVFSPKEEVKGVVYAFTDADCGYCRKLHQEVPGLNNMGIEVRYLAFPRGGKQSPAYAKMVDAWCSPERMQALSELKNGKEITHKASKEDKEQTRCEVLVEEQFEQGLKLGVSGTPALFLESGKAIPGYRPAAELARIMGITPPPAPETAPDTKADSAPKS